MPEKPFLMEPIDSTTYSKHYWNGELNPDAHYYSLTQTWNPQLYDYRQRIKSIRLYLRKLMNTIGNFKILYTIEYHKKRYPPTEDDLLRPHLHAIVETHQSLSVYTKKELQETFKRNIGKIDFTKLETQEDINRWIEYINKDVQKNEDKLQFGHRFSYIIEERVKKDLYDIDSDDY